MEAESYLKFSVYDAYGKVPEWRLGKKIQQVMILTKERGFQNNRCLPCELNEAIVLEWKYTKNYMDSAMWNWPNFIYLLNFYVAQLPMILSGSQIKMQKKKEKKNKRWQKWQKSNRNGERKRNKPIKSKEFSFTLSKGLVEESGLQAPLKHQKFGLSKFWGNLIPEDRHCYKEGMFWEFQ